MSESQSPRDVERGFSKLRGSVERRKYYTCRHFIMVSSVVPAITVLYSASACLKLQYTCTYRTPGRRAPAIYMRAPSGLRGGPITSRLQHGLQASLCSGILQLALLLDLALLLVSPLLAFTLVCLLLWTVLMIACLLYTSPSPRD